MFSDQAKSINDMEELESGIDISNLNVCGQNDNGKIQVESSNFYYLNNFWR